MQQQQHISTHSPKISPNSPSHSKSCLNHAFRGTTSANSVWESKLPPNYQDLLNRCGGSPSTGGGEDRFQEQWEGVGFHEGGGRKTRGSAGCGFFILFLNFSLSFSFSFYRYLSSVFIREVEVEDFWSR